MGFLDLQKVVHLVPEEISEEEKENLYIDFIDFEVQDEVDTKDLIKLFQICQEILKYKGEQVESLILELDNLAAKLGEEEAKRSKSTEEVHLGIATGDKNVRNVRLLATDTDDFHRKLVKMEIQNNQLVAELQEKEQELINEKKEFEKLSSRLSVLEDENKALRSELNATQQELASTTSLKSFVDDQDYPPVEKYHELTELLRQKNKHITQLLNDIEDTEKENITLKDKLAVVRDELAEGAEQMSKLSMERLSLSTCVDELKNNVSKLEQENAGLRNQISELVIDKEKRDQQFENMSANYESKIQQWKDILQKKEVELASLKLQYTSNSSNRISNETDSLAYLSDLSKTVVEREEKIVELQQQLEQATVDLNECTRLLEEQRELYKSKFDKDTECGLIKQLKKKLEQAESRVVVLEAKVKHAEEDSLKKAEEVTELIIQLREYESGTYGLEEAMMRLKELQKQKQVRDLQIEQLVQNSNQLRDDINLLEQENQILKDRLGIPSNEQIIVDDFSRRNHEKSNKLSELTEQLEKCQDELLSYRLENRKLSKQITSLQADLNFYRLKEAAYVDSDDNQETSELGMVTRYKKNLSVAIQSSLNEKFVNMDQEYDSFQDIIDENECLRKGMHEILDSIRNRDSSGIIQVESQTLERLLEALDSRHIAGWYQPAMRLQAYIHQLNGVNKTLREELHIFRQREGELLYELHEAYQKMEETQKSSQNFEIISPTIEERKVFSPKLKKSISCVEDVKSSYQTDKELKEQKEKCSQLEKEIKMLREKLTVIDKEEKRLHEKYEVDKESWLSIRKAMQEEIDVIKNNEQMLIAKTTEYEKSLEILKQSPEDIHKSFVESTFSITSLKVEQMQLSRKFQAVLEIERQVRQERNKFCEELHSLSMLKDQEIVELRKNVEQLSAEIKNQFLKLNECVSQYDYEKVVNDFNELTIKHREFMHKLVLIQSNREQILLNLQNKVASLLSQKAELEVSLKLTVEENKCLKCISADCTTSDQVTILTKQLASLEVEVINKKQYCDHLNRMSELTKEQLTEEENRCKSLENQLLISVQANSELQKNEVLLKERVLKLPNITEFEELVHKLRNAENEIISLQSQKIELEELANIAQEQVKALEQYNRFQDFEYDSLQRRILELQSVSDEKMVIDRLTRELLLLQQNSIGVGKETNNVKDKVVKLESEILQAKLKLRDCENNYNKLKHESNLKIRYMCSIVYELQKRYLGSFPVVKEELCFESIMHSKEECCTLISLVLDLRMPSVFNIDENEDDQNEYTLTRSAREERHKPKFKIQDFSMRLINEGLQNKIKIYAERLERQDKLINRLEQEIIHADEQCQEFLLYWSPRASLKVNLESEDIPNCKFTQTLEREIQPVEKQVEHNAAVPVGEPSDELKQANKTTEELRQKIKSLEEELSSTRDKLAGIMMQLKEKELIISNKETAMLNLQKDGYQRIVTYEQAENKNDENSVNKLALKATIDSLQNIINQKEDIIKRLQTMMKKNGEEHSQSVVNLLRELKVLQDTVDAKDQACNRLKTRLEAFEKPPNEKRSIIDSYLTKIHELEDELSQANEKVEQLSNQLASSNQQAELWSHTAEERLKTLQNMKHELDAKHESNTNDGNKISYISLLQIVKDKSEEIERQNQIIEDLKKRLGSGEKLPGYRDRLKNELERHKRKVELLEQREREDKAEIQRLKNQILTRLQSSKKKDVLVTPKEEQLLKKIKTLEEQMQVYADKEKKWIENRRTKIDSEFEKWQNKKRHQQNQDKLRQQLKEMTAQNESLKIINERLKDTVVRLEKERITLDSKLKAAKSQTASMSLIEELQKTNSRLEEEVKVLHDRLELTAGATSLTNVIEAQERKIKTLKIAQKGECALAEEVERLSERKSQLQKYNLHLEQQNMQLKLELERLKSYSKHQDELLDSNGQICKTDDKSHGEEMENQLKGNRRKNADLEKAVLVLRRVVEKLQTENKRLHSNKVAELQDKNYAEKLQVELQNLHENYLEAIEKISTLDKELKNAHEKNDSLQKLIDRLQNGEETASLRAQLDQKNRLLCKVKILLEKAASREKELLDKVNELQNTGSNVC